MSKRVREEEDDEAEKRLRGLAEEEATDLMEVIEAGQDAGVLALSLLAVLDTYGELQEMIVREALPNVHNLMLTSRMTSQSLAGVVHRILGRMFVREVHVAVRRLQNWGGYTYNTLANLCGNLGTLVYANEYLPPVWFLEQYGCYDDLCDECARRDWNVCKDCKEATLVDQMT